MLSDFLVMAAQVSPCTKCNLPINQGGCKCDKNCNCLPTGDWVAWLLQWDKRRTNQVFYVTLSATKIATACAN
jgi:hypothetical protein